MSVNQPVPRYCPVLMIEPGTMTKRDISRTERKGGIVIVECKAPAGARFVDPPAHLGMDSQARAAMALFRWISAKPPGASTYNYDLVGFFVRALIEGTPIPAVAPVKRT